MARSRVYTVNFNAVSISSVQDLIAVYAGANMACEFHSLQIGQISTTTVAGLRIRLRRFPATVTSGSGGSSATPSPLLPNDAAATSTARINDTTQASTSGTAQDISDVWMVLNGYLWLPPVDDRPAIKPSQAFVVSLDTAPAATTCSGTLTYAELF